ncbi:MAG: four helix bundle protein [Desulfobaccales bacterium]
MKSTSYRDLEVWTKAVGLAKIIYEVTSGFPVKENHRLGGQIQRSFEFRVLSFEF